MNFVTRYIMQMRIDEDLIVIDALQKWSYWQKQYDVLS